MEKILFHGSENIVETPLYGKGGKTNDYGRGFYCTEQEELAREWACAKNHSGYVNRYLLKLDQLSILNLNQGGYHILNWLALLAANRTYWQNSSISETAKRYLQEHFLPDISGYDVIIGYRADDSYFSFAQDFVAGTISLRQLSSAMRLGELGEQVVLISRKAFGQIAFCGAESVEASRYYPKKMLRDREARRAYRRMKQEEADIDGLYMLDIMREGMENGDPRLQ